MKFVVCTHSYLLLVAVDDDLQVQEVRKLDQGYYDGADVIREGDVIAAVRKTDPWKGDSPCEILWYNEHGRIPVLPVLQAPHVFDPHQITFDSRDRGLLITSTADNSIVYQSVADANETCKYFFLFGQEIADHNHINSIALTDDDSVVYFMFHNLSVQPSIAYRANWGGSRIFQPTSMHNTHYNGVHNVEILDPTSPELITYNASNDGAVIRAHWGSEEHDRAEIGAEYHPKGMALTDQYVVTGWSQHAVSTPSRYLSQSGLVFVDRQSWEVKAMPTILLGDSNVGNINEVRLYGKRKRCSSSPSTEAGADT